MFNKLIGKFEADCELNCFVYLCNISLQNDLKFNKTFNECWEMLFTLYMF